MLIIVIISLIVIVGHVAIFLVPKHKSTVPEPELIAKAEIFIAAGDGQKAIKILEPYLERYPNHEKEVYLLDAAKKTL